ncbi:MAG: hypothetical protein A3G75_04105 [Verrucomicrobia bacterium RIFCSPLOWO2_12_FULL_64_8]|nr:MAG: hypothetical protein A3G75_04105 [Verrucomicrobia bacterium RIFCSPLOWO2_12_FULL_64_8]
MKLTPIRTATDIQFQMKPIHSRLLGFFLLLVGLDVELPADVVETRNGARLVGKITKIDGGTVFLATDYAGDLGIKQAEIVRLSTDADVFVRLATGTTIKGHITPATAGGIRLAGADGEVGTSVDKVAAGWPIDAEDPAIVAARRRWVYQVSADITGKNGNVNSNGLAIGFTAVLASPQDTLKFYGSYQYASTEDAGITTKSADEKKAGIDYSSFFSSRNGWFVRSELEKDDVEGIDLRSTTDFGLTTRLIKNDRHTLVGRLGAGYRFESYPVGPNNKGMVLSTGLNYALNLGGRAGLVTDLQYLPSLDDFADYRFVHDSAFEIPVAADFWKLRLGLNHQYNSRPLSGRESLDTTYYTRLLLNWK